MENNSPLPRIGVFVCNCNTDVGGVIDVPAVVEFSKALPGIAYAVESLHACLPDDLCEMKSAIMDHNLDRIVVAGCTPRLYEPLFQGVVKEAGLKKNMLEIANIREQCSWVHANEPEAATEKAKTLVRMAVAKAYLLKPREEAEVDITPVALIIGGGIAGITAALSLANQGFQVHLVEKELQLGGMLRRLNKLFPLGRDCSELLTLKNKSATSNPNISIHTSSTVKSVEGFIGNFDVEIESRSIGLDKIKVGTIIVATGAVNFEPLGLYGYGRDERIITQLQLEERLGSSQLKGIDSVVMIQCVGSRNDERPYCSRICCTEAVKNSLLLKEYDRSKEVFILYRDFQSYGLQYSSLEWETKRQGVKFLKYLPEKPPEIDRKEEAILVKVFSPVLNEVMTVKADLLVLTTPMIPSPGTKELAKLLNVPLDSNGFFKESNVILNPVSLNTDGVYVCGMAHSPKDIGESILQALGAASRASIPMTNGKLITAAVTAEVDEKKCSGCGTCVELCPYKAIKKDDRGIAQVIKVICRGCGLCGASCPEGAVTMPNYTNDQLIAQCKAALGGPSK